MKEKYNCFIFDLDGTLIDSSYDIIDGVNFTLNKLNFKTLPGDEIMKYVGKGLKYLLEKVIPSKEEKIINQAYEIQKTYYETKNILAKPYELSTEFLDLLKQNNKNIFIVTNKPYEASLKVLKDLNLIDYFDGILGADSLKEKKPSAYPINHIIDNFNFKKQEVIFIGDSITDYKTSINSAVDFILITHGFESLANLRKIDAKKVSSFKELIENFNKKL